MPLPEFTKKLIEAKLSAYCLNRIPDHARDKIKLIFNINGNKVTLTETRPYYRDPSIWTENPVAQFRFDNVSKKWALYHIDRNDQWHPYDLTRPNSDIDDLLGELDRDLTGIFWGGGIGKGYMRRPLDGFRKI